MTMLDWYFIPIMLYIIGILVFLIIYIRDVNYDFNLHTVKISPKLARQSLIWPIFLLWGSLKILLVILLGISLFIQILFGRTE